MKKTSKSTRVAALLLISIMLVGVLSGCSGDAANKKAQLEALPLIDKAIRSDVIKYYEEEMKVASVAKRVISTATQKAEFRDIPESEMAILNREIQTIENLLKGNEYPVEYSTNWEGKLAPIYEETTPVEGATKPNTPKPEQPEQEMEYVYDDAGNFVLDEAGNPLMQPRQELPVKGNEDNRDQDFLLVGSTTAGILTRQMFNSMKSNIDDKTLTRKDISFSGATREVYIIDVRYNVTPRQEGFLVKDESKYIGVHGIFRRNQFGESYKDELFLTRLEKEIEKKELIKQQTATGGDGTASTEVQTDNLMSTRAYRPDGSYIEIADIDIAQYNSVLGVSLSSNAIMPRLDMVFTPGTIANGTMSGYGIFAQGSRALKEFGYNRNSITGIATVRYIFRINTETGLIQFDDVYLKDIHMDNITEPDNKDTFPSFAETAIEVLLDRMDRVISNNDITGMAGGRVFGSIRPSVFYGTRANSMWVRRQTSSVDEFLKRKDRFWLIKVNTVVQLETKYCNTGPGSYNDQYLMVLEQVGSQFIIVDYILINRSPMIEPSVVFESNVTKRYINMYNAEVITEENKLAVKEFMVNFYENARTRKWADVVASFDSDVELLGSERRSQLSSSIRSLMNKAGQEKQVTFDGYITEWLGGSSNPQIEFTTYEVVVYEGVEKAIKQTCYYLVSRFDNKWVIDDYKVLFSEEIGLRQAEQVKAEIESYKHREPTPVETESGE